MDAQLKYRLTGAVILVLLAVLFVPELLTGPARPRAAGSGPTPAPTTAEGAPLRSYDIDLGDTSEATPPEPAADETPVPSAEPPAGADDVRRDAPSRPAPAATPAAPRAAAPSAPSAGAPGVGANSGARPATGATAAPVPSVRTRPSAAPPPTATSPTEGFAVQVGSFSARGSADRLAGELRRRSFQAFVSQVRSGGKTMFRVRVGPVEDRAAAQALAARLKSAGQTGTVVPLP